MMVYDILLPSSRTNYGTVGHLKSGLTDNSLKIRSVVFDRGSQGVQVSRYLTTAREPAVVHDVVLYHGVHENVIRYPEQH